MPLPGLRPAEEAGSVSRAPIEGPWVVLVWQPGPLQAGHCCRHGTKQSSDWPHRGQGWGWGLSEGRRSLRNVRGCYHTMASWNPSHLGPGRLRVEWAEGWGGSWDTDAHSMGFSLSRTLAPKAGRHLPAGARGGAVGGGQGSPPRCVHR